MSSSLIFGSLSAPSLFSSHCLSLPLLTPFGGGSTLKYQKYIILHPSSRDTIRMNKISHKSIIREGIKEFKRTAFSTPTISRRNSLDARRQSYEKENENQLTISSLVSKHRERIIHFLIVFWGIFIELNVVLISGFQISKGCFHQ